MADKPLVSIVTPSFNRAGLIAKTLASVREQSYPHWEHLIVDDGSIDDTAVIVQEHAKDKCIRLLRRDRKPKGACTCRNIGIEHARGKYLLFLDSDDLLAPYCLEQRVAFLEQRPELDFAIFPTLLFRGSPHRASLLWNVNTGEDDLIRVLRMDPVCQSTGPLWKTASLKALGAWDKTLSMWQDIDLHLRAFAGNMRYAKRFDLPPDVYIRRHEASLSRHGYHERDKLESRIAVVKKIVSLLRETRQADRIPEVRPLCASVILGAAKSLNVDLALDLCTWGLRHGTLSHSDAWLLRLATLLHAARLTRLSAPRRWLKQATNRFRFPNTLGSVSVEDTAIPRAPTSSERYTL